MKKGGGKSKGSQFEREICRILTKWITGKANPVIFWRTAGSGSQHTNLKGNSLMVGDIMAIDERALPFTRLFCIECKFYKELDLFPFIDNKGIIYSWWKELIRKSNETNKHPLLIFKRNRSSIFCMFSSSIFKKISEISGHPDHQFISFKGKHVMLMKLFNFLDWIDDVEKLTTLMEEN